MCDHTYNSDNIYFNDQNDNEICDLTEKKDGDQLSIDLVRLYPHLWDKQKQDFKDATKKETSWEEISSILNQSVSVCQARWQRLRQYYAKERQKQELESRSGSKAVNRMPWYLFRSMNFLDSHMYKRRTFTNFRKSATEKSSTSYINDICDSDLITQSVSSESCIPTLDNRNRTPLLTNSNSVSPLNSSKIAPKLTTDSVQRLSPSLPTNISTKLTPSPNSTSPNNRDPFLDLTNSNLILPLNSSETTLFSKSETVPIQKSSLSTSPQINTCSRSTPSPRSTSSTPSGKDAVQTLSPSVSPTNIPVKLTPSPNSTSLNSRDPFLDLTNSNSILPLNSGTTLVSKSETVPIQRSSLSTSPQINTCSRSTPSPRSTSSTPKCSTASGKMNVDCFIDSFEAVSSSIVQLSNQVKEKRNEGKDHAFANLVLKELQDAEEPKKSMLRKKIMQILMDHMNNS